MYPLPPSLPLPSQPLSLPSQPHPPPHPHPLPSQPPLNTTLEQRRLAQRRRRFHPTTAAASRNPLVDSPQYQAYRAKQNRDGGSADKPKWPDVLEVAFLDALTKFPQMGRRKFSIKNKPHGRNELIREYLWLAYLDTLAPGEPPDPLMMRSRKQVSSHIQVVKGFLRGHPARRLLFPPKKDPKNGFEESFKDDSTLRALAEGRLPAHRPDEYDHIPGKHQAMAPSAFWLLMTPCAVPNERNGLPKSELDLRNEGLVLHRYSGLAAGARPRGTLESIAQWRQRFPYLAHLLATEDLNCEIIHMDVSLDLMETHAPDKSELLTRLEMTLPGRALAPCAWKSVTSLIKPAELYGDPSKDPMLDGSEFPMYVVGHNSTETRIKVAVPAETWAYTFTQLMNLHFELEKKRNILGSSSSTSNAWSNCDLQTSHNGNGLLDPFVQGLATPPHTASLQSPFDAPDGTQQVFSYPSHPGFDMSMSEGLSFVSQATADSESTLVDLHTERQLDNLFSAHVNAGALAEYDADGVGANWHLQGAEQAFDADGGWDGYSGPGWETTGVNGKDNHDGNGGLGWPDTTGAGSVGHVGNLSGRWPGTSGTGVDEEKRHEADASWGQHGEEGENTLDTSLRDTKKVDGRDELPWSDVVLGNSPNKQNGAVNNYIEGSIESKLLPWIEQATAEEEAQAQAQAREAFQEVEVVSAGATSIVDIEALERAVEATENAKQENGLGYHGADLNGQHEAEAQGWGRLDHDNIGGSAEAVVGGFDYQHLDESVSVK
ncbi:transcription factor protein [Rutstroemia sp. NJR-2017a BBW]|nr:transcription factor protein [Rutstroemia sp. NJR-2017a BBW]PQE08704.1 transcription factor protein [Rutstroemia sp. NJR-2017a BBW]